MVHYGVASRVAGRVSGPEAGPVAGPVCSLAGGPACRTPGDCRWGAAFFACVRVLATPCSCRLRYQTREGWCVRVAGGGRDQWRWSVSTIMIVGNPKSMGEGPAETVAPQVFL